MPRCQKSIRSHRFQESKQRLASKDLSTEEENKQEVDSKKMGQYIGEGKRQRAHLDLTYEHSILEGGNKQVSSHGRAGWGSSTQGRKLAFLHPCHIYLAVYARAWSKKGLTSKLHMGHHNEDVAFIIQGCMCCHCWKVTITQVSLYFPPLRC